jgi:hypothetical protein
LDIDANREYILASYFSEPILALAALALLQRNAAAMLTDVQQLVARADLGVRGEFAAQLYILLCTWRPQYLYLASDMPLHVFLNRLVGPHARQCSQEDVEMALQCSNPTVRLTHFVQALGQATSVQLRECYKHGRALSTIRNYPAIDIIIPVAAGLPTEAILSRALTHMSESTSQLRSNQAAAQRLSDMAVALGDHSAVANMAVSEVAADIDASTHLSLTAGTGSINAGPVAVASAGRDASNRFVFACAGQTKNCAGQQNETSLHAAIGPARAYAALNHDQHTAAQAAAATENPDPMVSLVMSLGEAEDAGRTRIDIDVSGRRVNVTVVGIPSNSGCMTPEAAVALRHLVEDSTRFRAGSWLQDAGTRAWAADLLAPNGTIK